MDTSELKIKRMTVDSPTKSEYIVGGVFTKEINKIEKPGEMAMVTWYQVIGNDKSIKEINGKYVIEVEYEKGDIK
jgi:hypothetical protein